MTRVFAFRILLAAAASIGLVGGANLSILHFHNGDVCPVLVGLPACYLVLLGYGLIVISAFSPQSWRARLFYLGWTPIFALALFGAVLHTFVRETCPVSNGVPQCYISLGLALILFAIFFFGLRNQKPL